MGFDGDMDRDSLLTEQMSLPNMLCQFHIITCRVWIMGLMDIVDGF